VRALAIKYVVNPLFEEVVVDNIYSKFPHGMPGSMKRGFLSCFFS